MVAINATSKFFYFLVTYWSYKSPSIVFIMSVKSTLSMTSFYRKATPKGSNLFQTNIFHSKSPSLPWLGRVRPVIWCKKKSMKHAPNLTTHDRKPQKTHCQGLFLVQLRKRRIVFLFILFSHYFGENELGETVFKLSWLIFIVTWLL